MLVVVPAVFVVVAAPALANASEVLGGAGSATAVEGVTPGWAAGFLIAVAMYFQVSTARGADVRLAQAGCPPWRIVAARIGTGLLIAAGVSAVALLALVLRTGTWVTGRTVLGTAAFAVIYLGVGTAVGAIVTTAINGTVLILFIWILDVFFGPSMSAATQTPLRLMPTHLTTMWALDLPTNHAASLGNAGGMAAWVTVSLAVATVLQLRMVGVVRQRPTPLLARGNGRFSTDLRAGMLGLARVPLLWGLLVVVPVVFITLASAVTPSGTTLIAVMENGRSQLRPFDPARIHGAVMAPIAVASLAALVGLFLALDDRPGDRRLALAGGGRFLIVASRLLIVVMAALGVTGVALAVTGAQFTPGRWTVYALGNALVAVTYGLVGVLIGPVFGRVAGVFIAFLAPFLDIGISQSPMLRGQPERWAQFLPGYGGVRVAVDGALTTVFDQPVALTAAAVWAAALAVLTLYVLVRGLPHIAGTTTARRPR
ncbi:MAG: ABC transporter permease [Actinobacteria bacterium]|nr:ABC transporter permease [Actinomycetota bacterium]